MRISSNAVVPPASAIGRVPLTEEVVLVLRHGRLLAGRIEKRPDRPAAEVMRETTMHADRRPAGIDQPVAVVRIGIEERHLFIDVADLFNTFRGDKKTISAEAIGFMRGVQSLGKVPVGGGVVILARLMLLSQAQIGVGFLKASGSRQPG